MQTQSDEEEVEERENEEQTPRASPTSSAWLEDVEKERLERELEERNAEIRKLKEALQKTKSGPEQVRVANVLIHSPLSPHSTNFIHQRELITAVS